MAFVRAVINSKKNPALNFVKRYCTALARHHFSDEDRYQLQLLCSEVGYSPSTGLAATLGMQAVYDRTVPVFAGVVKPAHFRLQDHDLLVLQRKLSAICPHFKRTFSRRHVNKIPALFMLPWENVMQGAEVSHMGVRYGSKLSEQGLKVARVNSYICANGGDLDPSWTGLWHGRIDFFVQVSIV